MDIDVHKRHFREVTSDILRSQRDELIHVLKEHMGFKQVNKLEWGVSIMFDSGKVMYHTAVVGGRMDRSPELTTWKKTPWGSWRKDYFHAGNYTDHVFDRLRRTAEHAEKIKPPVAMEMEQQFGGTVWKVDSGDGEVRIDRQLASVRVHSAVIATTGGKLKGVEDDEGRLFFLIEARNLWWKRVWFVTDGTNIQPVIGRQIKNKKTKRKEWTHKLSKVVRQKNIDFSELTLVDRTACRLAIQYYLARKIRYEDYTRIPETDGSAFPK